MANSISLRGLYLIFIPITLSLKSKPKQSAVFLGISQYRGEHVVSKVKPGDGFFKRIVFIHRDDVLKAQFLCCFRADLQRAYQLPAIDTIEKMTVVDQVI